MNLKYTYHDLNKQMDEGLKEIGRKMGEYEELHRQLDLYAIPRDPNLVVRFAMFRAIVHIAISPKLPMHPDSEKFRNWEKTQEEDNK